MIENLIGAFQLGKSLFDQTVQHYEGNHFAALQQAEAMIEALDENDGYEEGLHEILDVLSAIDKTDRAYVQAAAFFLRGLVYCDLGDTVKARQNLAYCTNIEIDPFTIEPERIREYQMAAEKKRREIDNALSSKSSASYVKSKNNADVFDEVFSERFPELDEDTIHSVLSVIFNKLNLDDNISNMNLCDMAPNDILGETYGADELDLTELIMEIESVLGVTLPDSLNPFDVDITVEELLFNVSVALGNDKVDMYSLPFSMPVEDVFDIPGRGVVITGTIASGRIHVDDVIYLVKNDVAISATVKGCEMFKKLLDQAEYGDNVGILLVGVSAEQVESGMMATAVKPEGFEMPMPTIQKDEPRSAKLMNTPQASGYDSASSVEQEYLDEVKEYLADGEIGPRERRLLDRFASRLGISQERVLELETTLTANTLSDNEKEYLEEVKECLTDGAIGPRERRLLDKLASKLGITPERVAELEASLSTPTLTDDEKEYLEEVQAVLADGSISDKERRLLEKLRKMLDISEERAKEIEAFATHV